MRAPTYLVLASLLTSLGAGALRAEARRLAESARLVTGRGRQLGAGRSAGKASPA